MPESSAMGRPRDEAIDRAILRAAVALFEERGFGHVTVTDIVERAGTSKPAFYRRYDSVAGLVPAILAARFEIDPPEPGERLEDDLQRFQAQQAVIFRDPLVQRSMAGWFLEAAGDPREAEPFLRVFHRARLEALQAALDRAALRGEIAADAGDAVAVTDILVGPFLMRAMLPGVGDIDDDLASRTIVTALAYLRGR